MGELIAECIVSGAEWEFVPHQVDDGRSRGNEEDFHATVLVLNMRILSSGNFYPVGKAKCFRVSIFLFIYLIATQQLLSQEILGHEKILTS